jgi:hypothetical protein
MISSRELLSSDRDEQEEKTEKRESGLAVTP